MFTIKLRFVAGAEKARTTVGKLLSHRYELYSKFIYFLT